MYPTDREIGICFINTAYFEKNYYFLIESDNRFCIVHPCLERTEVSECCASRKHDSL